MRRLGEGRLWAFKGPRRLGGKRLGPRCLDRINSGAAKKFHLPFNPVMGKVEKYPAWKVAGQARNQPEISCRSYPGWLFPAFAASGLARPSVQC